MVKIIETLMGMVETMDASAEMKSASAELTIEKRPGTKIADFAGGEPDSSHQNDSSDSSGEEDGIEWQQELASIAQLYPSKGSVTATAKEAMTIVEDTLKILPQSGEYNLLRKS